jgi:hypothetical protein
MQHCAYRQPGRLVGQQEATEILCREAELEKLDLGGRRENRTTGDGRSLYVNPIEIEENLQTPLTLFPEPPPLSFVCVHVALP